MGTLGELLHNTGDKNKIKGQTVKLILQKSSGHVSQF